MSILEEFYFGNIIPNEIPSVPSSDYAKANKLAIRHDEGLTATLTEQQKKIFQKYKDNNIELLNLGECDAFIRVFSLGIKFMAEALK